MSSPGIAPGNPPLLSIAVATPPLLPPNDNGGNIISSPTAAPALPLASPILSPPSPPPAEAIASPPSPAEVPIASPPSPPTRVPGTPPPSPKAEPIAPPPSPPVSTPTTPLPSLPSSSPPPQPPPVTPSAKPPLPPSTVVLPPPPLISPPAPTHNTQTPEPPQPSPSTPTTPAPIAKPSPKPQPSTSPRSKSWPVEAPPPSSLPQPPPQPPTIRRGRNVPPAKTNTPTATAPPVSSKSPSVSKTLPSKPKTSQPPSTLPTLPVSSPGIASSPSALLVPQPQLPPGINASPAPPGGEGGGGMDMPDPIMASNGTAGKPSVPQGAVVGLCVGGVLLVVLLVFSVLLFVCRKRKNFDDGNVKYSGSTFAGLQGKTNTATEQGLIFKQSIDQPGNIQALGQSNGGSGSSNSLPASAMAFTSPNPPGIAITISTGTFTYEELVAATDGFSISNLLGQGGFGYVHKGVLPNGKEVAVKQLKMGGQQGEREFQAEVETISQVHHKHLVSLVGYCIAGTERLLVYEFVPNQTMEFHLHGTEQSVMEWGTRVKIAVGSAKGLAYLHEDCNPSIIHRDIKAANILLDFNFEAKVADFGLAKIFSNTSSEPITHITTRVVGTFGYLAPEYASSGKVTDKSDVYSFGVMLLELITGRRPITATESDKHRSLVDWARPLLTQAIADGNYDTLADTRLQGNYDTNDMASMVACAAACIRFSASRRPRMSQVIRALEGDLSPSDLDDGIAPRETSVNFPYTDQYMENMRKIRMALTSNVSHAASRYSDTTSEYGLRSSVSSTDSPQIKATTTDGAQGTTVSSIGLGRLR